MSQSGSCGGGEKWLNSGCVLKGEAMRHYQVGCGCVRASSPGRVQHFQPEWLEGVVISADGEVGERVTFAGKGRAFARKLMKPSRVIYSIEKGPRSRLGRKEGAVTETGKEQ